MERQLMQAMTNYLIIDVGTSSMRGILFDETGAKLHEKQCFYQVTYLEEGRAEQDPKDWEQALGEIFQDVYQKTRTLELSVSAVAVTAQRSSVIPMDHNGQPLHRAIMWQDKRTAGICSRLSPYDREIFTLCGSRVNPVFSGSKMTWIRENEPDIYSKVWKFMTVPDFLLYRMTGKARTDETYGSRSNLMNLRTRQWDDRLLELFGVEKEKLCDIFPVGTVLGSVTDAFAKEWDVPEAAGIPVLSAGGDQQCGAIGQGVVREGLVSVTAGTGGFLITAVNKVPKDLDWDVLCNCASVPGMYILESSVLTCASAFDWVRREFYPDADYDEITKQLESTPIGADGCICVPYFQGRSTPDWNNAARAQFCGISLHTRKADFLRAVLEGICMELGNGIRTMEKYVNVGEVHVSGGLSGNRIFNEMQCNVYGRKVIRDDMSDATAVGALMVLLTGLGRCRNFDEAYAITGSGYQRKEYLPDEEQVEAYEQLRSKMNLLYDRNRDV